MTIGIDYGVVKCENVSISIFDVGGHELFREVRQEFYADTEAVLLVFDARDVHPITSLQRWVKEFGKYGGKINEALGTGFSGSSIQSDVKIAYLRQFSAKI